MVLLLGHNLTTHTMTRREFLRPGYLALLKWCYKARPGSQPTVWELFKWESLGKDVTGSGLTILKVLLLWETTSSRSFEPPYQQGLLMGFHIDTSPYVQLFSSHQDRLPVYTTLRESGGYFQQNGHTWHKRYIYFTGLYFASVLKTDFQPACQHAETYFASWSMSHWFKHAFAQNTQACESIKISHFDWFRKLFSTTVQPESFCAASD